MSLSTNARLYLPNIVGAGYASFWNWKGRYRVVKGSRASKKSKTMALWLIYNLLKYPEANALVVRKTYRSLEESCFTDLQWACRRLGLGPNDFVFKTSPLRVTRPETGQVIYFRGLDDPDKISSISVKKGALCWCWIEEGYEITNEKDFDKLDGSIRGALPDGLFHQITITLNPWSDRHWIKKRFFDNPDDQTLAITTNYLINEFLSESDRLWFENMRINKPTYYKTAGLGEWGIVEGLVYENWKEERFNVKEITQRETVRSCFGLDFGYVNDPSALFCGLIDQRNKELFVFDELYQRGMSNERIAEKIKSLGYGKERIIADSSAPKDIDRLRQLGLTRIRGSRKGKGSVMHGIDYLQDYKIIIHPSCTNFLTEIGNYAWAKDKYGNAVNEPIDEFNHLMDAMRYATERFARADTYSFD